ncbi:uncharacterized protein LY79DRAFT_131459 [Colletotrichum navitas]|uniref:Uncharacterized protein n=1 Tax=Colletotrichum navitas TaxID=681940 RepID=A0AAD8Q474_9PEZI|nr:uncharacterized protein LY79DRAFT_131459 [Colletotrichum navitas]KAK1594524.1 hypothetical protein LY79DRAFT_131459 [Colletotrichum navitas]
MSPALPRSAFPLLFHLIRSRDSLGCKPDTIRGHWSSGRSSTCNQAELIASSKYSTTLRFVRTKRTCGSLVVLRFVITSLPSHLTLRTRSIGWLSSVARLLLPATGHLHRTWPRKNIAAFIPQIIRPSSRPKRCVCRVCSGRQGQPANLRQQVCSSKSISYQECACEDAPWRRNTWPLASVPFHAGDGHGHLLDVKRVPTR